ncbi:MAG: LysE family transporter [Pseudomonadales bacterium]|jgi:RhtB (resistance to homoserine/threonine) family protein|nr:LysE family transporter [Pseudomonadales bacterium]
MLLALLGLVLAQAVAVVSPGPSFVVVMRGALAQGANRALWVAFGLGLGTFVWAASALFGLGLLFATFPWLYLGLRIAGAAFLLWMAVMLWRHAHAPLPEADTTETPEGSAIAALRTGMLTQLANPKVAVFFGSIFVTFLPPEPGLAFQLTALSCCVLVEWLWFGTVALAFTHRAVRARYAAAKHVIDRVTGTVLAGLGARLVLAP